MLLDNLTVNFDREEGGRLIFQANDGSEIVLAKNLINTQLKKGDLFYLSLNGQPLAGTDKAKQILNELLDGDNN